MSSFLNTLMQAIKNSLCDQDVETYFAITKMGKYKAIVMIVCNFSQILH